MTDENDRIRDAAHILFSRVQITLEWLERFNDGYGDIFPNGLEAECKCCGKRLETGDFVDGLYPYDETYCVCFDCESKYTLEQAD